MAMMPTAFGDKKPKKSTKQTPAKKPKKSTSKAKPVPKKAKGKQVRGTQKSNSGKIRTKYFLTVKEIQKTVAPYLTDISTCYKRYGTNQKHATGELRVEMVVEPLGIVRRHTVIAPGVRGKRLDRCIKKVVDKLIFPQAKRFTTAVIPFFFLHTKVKGAGPFETCWSLKGCPDRRRRIPKKKQQRPRR